MRTFRVDLYKKSPEFALMVGNPFEKVMFRKGELPEPLNHYFVDDHEFSKLLSAADALGYDELYSLLLVYRYLGLRKTEPMMLTANDVRNDHVVVRSSKTNAIRVVPLFSEISRELHNRATEKRGPLFSYAESTLDRHFKAVVKKAGVYEHITLHSLRKTFGSALINNVPLKLISKWLGHSSVTMTEQWYLVLLDNDFGKWVDIGKEVKNNERTKLRVAV
jgi:integrase